MMSPRKKFLCLGLLLLCPLRHLTALEVTRGNFKLVLHEGIGRFTLYTSGGKTDAEYTPLFVAQDPRTTVMTIIAGDALYKIGETRKFAETAQRTAEGARFCWVSEELKISEDFVFIPEGVSVRIVLSNQSGRELTVGMRLCLDTYLGEKGPNHFSTSRHAAVSRELEILKKDMVSYWRSSSRDEKNSVSLYSHTSGGGVTVPDRIVFANWKRISDTAWNFETSSSRNFNLMPYSINDSAVCHYYSPRSLPPGQVRSINLLFTTGEDVQAAAAAREPRSAAPSTPAEQAPSAEASGGTIAEAVGASSDPYKDLLAINALVEEIDALILQGAVSSDEIERLRGILEALRRSTAAYAGSE